MSDEELMQLVAGGDSDGRAGEWGPRWPLSGSTLRGPPELDKACCDRRNFIRVCLLDIVLKLFEILRGLGTTHIP